jgi:glucuronate isomerase
MPERSPLSPDRFFSAEPGQRKIARQLYDSVLNLPLISPCIRLNPRIFVDSSEVPPDPCELLLFSDLHLIRRLNAQGFNLNGYSQKPNRDPNQALDYRKVWQAFVEKLYLLHGLPVDVWLADTLYSVFGVKEKLAPKNAQRIYEALADNLKQPDFQPARLIERFNVESLGILGSPTESIWNEIRAGSNGKIFPCVYADPLFALHSQDWVNQIGKLNEVVQAPITTLSEFIRAIQKLRIHFKSLGATTFVQSIQPGDGIQCSKREIETIFERACRQEATLENSWQFSNFMLSEMASLSAEDNLIFQLFPGDNANLDPREPSNELSKSDLPNQSVTFGLKSFFEKFGRDNRISIIYMPEFPPTNPGLEPCLDRYPTIKIGTPDWFFHGLTRMQQYYGQFVEVFGVYRMSGLNQPVGSLLTLPAKHDIWRRSSADWLARLVSCGLVDLESAYEIIYALAYSLAKTAYHLK